MELFLLFFWVVVVVVVVVDVVDAVVFVDVVIGVFGFVNVTARSVRNDDLVRLRHGDGVRNERAVFYSS